MGKSLHSPVVGERLDFIYSLHPLSHVLIFSSLDPTPLQPLPPATSANGPVLED